MLQEIAATAKKYQFNDSNFGLKRGRLIKMLFLWMCGTFVCARGLTTTSAMKTISKLKCSVCGRNYFDDGDGLLLNAM